MSRLNAWFIAIFVLDANILLGLYRLAPEKRRQLFELLEALCDRIWIPRQFWEEYQRRRYEMRQHISREYGQAHSRLQSSRDKSKKSLIHLTTRFSFDAALHIPRIDALYAEIIADVLQSSNEHINSTGFEEIDERIEALCVERVGDPLPDSTSADIPSIWQWRLDRNIPPGLKDCKKPAPNRYGDLIGWLQIVRHAVGRGRPVIMVTDDVKANDWFILKNGNPSGPHPDLTRELYDEAGVELYLYTSEQFMWFANRYLKWQHHVADAGDYFRRHTRVFSPEFGKIAATGNLTALTARGDMLNGYTNSFSSLTGIGLLGGSRTLLRESVAGLGSFGLGSNLLQESVAGLSSFGLDSNLLRESVAGISSFGLGSNLLRESVAGIGSFGLGSNLLQETFAGLGSFGDSRNLLQETLAGTGSLGDSRNLLQESVARIGSLDVTRNLLRESVAGIGSLHNSLSTKSIISDSLRTYDFGGLRAFGMMQEPILEQQQRAIHPYLEQQRRTEEMMEPYLEQQRRFEEMMEPYLEQQRRFEEMMEPYLEQQRRFEEMMEPYLEQQRLIEEMIKPYLEQQRLIEEVIKPYLEQQRRFEEMMKPVLEAQQRFADNVLKNLYS